jgi:trigger factor
MQVSVETTTTLERRVTVSLPAERIDNAVDKKVRQTAKTIRIDGFRKGKVPTSLVKKRYGASIRQEIMGEVIEASYFEAIAEVGIKPASMPSIKPHQSNTEQDFSYVAVVEVYPEISLVEPATLSVERQFGTVQDTDVDDMVTLLQKQHVQWLLVDRASVNGDQVNIDFTGYIGDEAFEGGTGQGRDLVLGTNSMITGFEAGIIGMKAGDQKEITVVFPEDYSAEHLQGQQARFTIKVNKVSEADLPELNDAFFALFNPKEKGELGFRKEVKSNMVREMDQTLRNKLKRQVLDAYLKLHQFDVPKTLVDSEIQRMKQESSKQFSGSAGTLDTSKLPDEIFTDQAIHRVKMNLLVTEIIKFHEFKATAEKVRALLESMAQGYDEPQEFIDHYVGNKEKLAQIEGLVLENQVLDHLLSAASITDIEVDYQAAVELEKQHHG